MTASPPDTGAILALWNDIDEARIPEYERWHTLEHVPERVWVPGFIAGSRYVSMAAAQVRYFTLYEMASLAPLDSAEYEDLVANPTPWSASMRPSFASFLRKPCTVLASAGVSQGAALAVMRMVWPQDMEQDRAGALAGTLLCEGAQACVTHVRIARVEHAGPQAIRNAQDSPDGCEYLALVQTADIDALPAIDALIRKTVAALAPLPALQRCAGYRFASRVLHEDVRQAARPAPRTDLMPQGRQN